MAFVTNFSFSHLTVAKGSKVWEGDVRDRFVACTNRTPMRTTWACDLLPVLCRQRKEANEWFWEVCD